MAQYRVVWEIDVDADTPRGAAKKALAIQRDVFSCATYFTVKDVADGTEIDIDLEEVQA